MVTAEVACDTDRLIEDILKFRVLIEFRVAYRVGYNIIYERGNIFAGGFVFDVERVENFVREIDKTAYLKVLGIIDDFGSRFNRGVFQYFGLDIPDEYHHHAVVRKFFFGKNFRYIHYVVRKGCERGGIAQTDTLPQHSVRERVLEKFRRGEREFTAQHRLFAGDGGYHGSGRYAVFHRGCRLFGKHVEHGVDKVVQHYVESAVAYLFNKPFAVKFGEFFKRLLEKVAEPVVLYHSEGLEHLFGFGKNLRDLRFENGVLYLIESESKFVAAFGKLFVRNKVHHKRARARVILIIENVFRKNIEQVIYGRNNVADVNISERYGGNFRFVLYKEVGNYVYRVAYPVVVADEQGDYILHVNEKLFFEVNVFESFYDLSGGERERIVLYYLRFADKVGDDVSHEHILVFFRKVGREYRQYIVRRVDNIVNVNVFERGRIYLRIFREDSEYNRFYRVSYLRVQIGEQGYHVLNVVNYRFDKRIFERVEYGARGEFERIAFYNYRFAYKVGYDIPYYNV